MADAEVISCGVEEDPNQRPDRSSVLQAARSGKSAAAVIQPRLLPGLFFVVADLLFTLHLIIAVSGKVISFLADKNNCRK
ncbi:hypothetical protein [Thalassospira tepidiphila]|uniref:hypothetical protein n=1 Tax=Thalassospira tepidiphila TaxID=393657 RepID=UPI001BCA71FF|nr:hypothetical protein [Thalassospira tepidiphila]